MERLRLHLSKHPDQQQVHRLLDNLLHGHSLEYRGPIETRWSNNLKSVIQMPMVAQTKVDKEVQLGRVAGPFDSIQQTGLEHLIISPIGLVPKSSGGPITCHSHGVQG